MSASSLAAVSSQSRLVFCPPRLGKPTEKEPKSPDGPDERTRVIHKGSHNNDCWDAVFRLIAEHYEAPNTADWPQRKFELHVLKRRQDLLDHERSLPEMCRSMREQKEKSALQSLTKDKCQQFLQSGGLRPVCPDKYLQDFLSQNTHENLYDFAMHLKIDRRTEINFTFLSELGINQRTNVERRDQSLSNIVAGGLLDGLVRFVTACGYGLKQSRWFPGAPIEQLMDTLEKEGPIAVGGSLSFNYKTAEKLKRIGDRWVWGWKGGKSDRYEMGAPIGHSLLIVGAEVIAPNVEKKLFGKNLVYFVDARDDSDPGAPEKQKIYTVSHEKFTATNVNSLGTRILDVFGRGDERYSPLTCYGFYCPKWTPKPVARIERDFYELFVAVDKLRKLLK